MLSYALLTRPHLPTLWSYSSCEHFRTRHNGRCLHQSDVDAVLVQLNLLKLELVVMWAHNKSILRVTTNCGFDFTAYFHLSKCIRHPTTPYIKDGAGYVLSSDGCSLFSELPCAGACCTMSNLTFAAGEGTPSSGAKLTTRLEYPYNNLL